MLSILVCSVHPERLRKFQENVRETVGVPCEFIVHDNRNVQYSITKVYNLCAEKARYDYLCFVHEDICFRTKDWGVRLIELLKQPKTGVVGFAGSTYKSKAYSGWGTRRKYSRYNYVQHFKDGNVRTYTSNPDRLPASQVVVLDGMCLLMRKSVWEEFRFDDNMFKGFHLYDLDISLAVGQKYANYVTNEVMVEHFSEGAYTKGWLDDTIVFHRKWSHRLPIYIHAPGQIGTFNDERKVSYRFIRRLMKKCIGEWSFIERCCSNYLRQYYWCPSTLGLLQWRWRYKRQWRRKGLI